MEDNPPGFLPWAIFPAMSGSSAGNLRFATVIDKKIGRTECSNVALPCNRFSIVMPTAPISAITPLSGDSIIYGPSDRRDTGHIEEGDEGPKWRKTVGDPAEGVEAGEGSAARKANVHCPVQIFQLEIGSGGFSCSSIVVIHKFESAEPVAQGENINTAHAEIAVAVVENGDGVTRHKFQVTSIFFDCAKVFRKEQSAVRGEDGKRK